MAHLSIHVLDTVRGVPAAGVIVEVRIIRGTSHETLATATTNRDGRARPPMFSCDRFDPGVYDLIFHVGDYFVRAGFTLTNPPFLDSVVLRLGIADPNSNYHIVLLITPYGYTTYRGT